MGGSWLISNDIPATNCDIFKNPRFSWQSIHLTEISAKKLFNFEHGSGDKISLSFHLEAIELAGYSLRLAIILAKRCRPESNKPGRRKEEAQQKPTTKGLLRSSRSANEKLLLPKNRIDECYVNFDGHITRGIFLDKKMLTRSWRLHCKRYFPVLHIRIVT